MRDTWGPPDTGWPSFDAEGKRVTQECADEDCPCHIDGERHVPA